MTDVKGRRSLTSYQAGQGSGFDEGEEESADGDEERKRVAYIRILWRHN